MRTYRSGSEFEFAVFGKSATFFGNRAPRGARNFSDEVKRIIAEGGPPFPATEIGISLYRYIKKYLVASGVDTNGLVLLPTADTRLDSPYNSDGILYVPSVGRYPVTIDAFNLEADLEGLKTYWLDTFEGVEYGVDKQQSDLFSFKKGLIVSNMLHGRKCEFFPSHVFDPRVDCKRPENHFILTPYHTKDYKERRKFAKMIAGYLAGKAWGRNILKNTA
jgi:hypothetical protein